MTSKHQSRVDRLLNRLTEEQRKFIAEAQQDSPVRLSELAKKLNLKIQVETMPTLISGEIRPDGDGSYIIKINKHEVKSRQRFTLAHEIAHSLLHQDLIKQQDGLYDSVLYRSTKINSFYETEANYLAAEILMPSHLLERFDNRYDLSSLKNGDFEISKIANELGVSTTALEIKLGLRD